MVLTLLFVAMLGTIIVFVVKGYQAAQPSGCAGDVLRGLDRDEVAERLATEAIPAEGRVETIVRIGAPGSPSSTTITYASLPDGRFASGYSIGDGDSRPTKMTWTDRVFMYVLTDDDGLSRTRRTPISIARGPDVAVAGTFERSSLLPAGMLENAERLPLGDGDTEGVESWLVDIDGFCDSDPEGLASWAEPLLVADADNQLFLDRATSERSMNTAETLVETFGFDPRDDLEFESDEVLPGASVGLGDHQAIVTVRTMDGAADVVSFALEIPAANIWLGYDLLHDDVLWVDVRFPRGGWE